MGRTKGTSAAVVDRAGDLPAEAPPPEEIARRARVVAEMRRRRDEVIGQVHGTTAELLSEEPEDLAHR